MAVRVIRKKDLEKNKRINRNDSEKLKEIRTKLGLTQSKLSEKIGIPQSLISCVENGIKPAPYKLKLAVATELGIDFDGIESYEELFELWHKSRDTISSLKAKLNKLQQKLDEIEK